MQSMQQHSHPSVIASASSNAVTSNNYVPKVPSSSVISSSFNTSSDYNTSSYPNTRTMQANQQNRMVNNYAEVSSPYQQHGFPQNVIHQGVAGSSKSQSYNPSESGNQSTNYGYPNVIQNTSMGMTQPLASMPTPTPTPSPTPTQSPTRYMTRASVITSDNSQQNGMFPMPAVANKYLMSNDMNLNMSDQTMIPDLNPSALSNMVEQLPPILDPQTNQPIQIPPQLQSQIESHLQLNGQNHLGSQIDSQEMYPADMLESTIGSSMNLNDVPIISGDLSMTPPLSGSVPQIDSVPQMPSKFS